MGILCSFSEIILLILLLLLLSYAKALYRNLVNDCTLETHDQNFDRLVKIEPALLVNMVACKFVNCVTKLVGAQNNKLHKFNCMGSTWVHFKSKHCGTHLAGT